MIPIVFPDESFAITLSDFLGDGISGHFPSVKFARKIIHIGKNIIFENNLCFIFFRTLSHFVNRTVLRNF